MLLPISAAAKGVLWTILFGLAKTCRGSMTRFIIENRIDNPEDLCAFSYEEFTYEPTLGEPDYPHFIKQ